MVDLSTTPPETIFCMEEVMRLLLAIYRDHQGLGTRWDIWENAQEHSPFHCSLSNKTFQPVNHDWEDSSQVEDIVSYQFPSPQLSQTTLAIIGPFLFSQSSASYWKDTSSYSVVWEHSTEREMLDGAQWGFMPGKSTVYNGSRV